MLTQCFLDVLPLSMDLFTKLFCLERFLFALVILLQGFRKGLFGCWRLPKYSIMSLYLPDSHVSHLRHHLTYQNMCQLSVPGHSCWWISICEISLASLLLAWFSQAGAFCCYSWSSLVFSWHQKMILPSLLLLDLKPCLMNVQRQIWLLTCLLLSFHSQVLMMAVVC